MKNGIVPSSINLPAAMLAFNMAAGFCPSIQPNANVPEAAEDGPPNCAPATYMGDLDEAPGCWHLALALPSPSHGGNLGCKSVNRYLNYSMCVRVRVRVCVSFLLALSNK